MSEFWNNLISNAGGALVGTFGAFLLGSFHESQKNNKQNKKKFTEYKNKVNTIATLILNESFTSDYMATADMEKPAFDVIKKYWEELISTGIILRIMMSDPDYNSKLCSSSIDSSNKDLDKLLSFYSDKFVPECERNFNHWTYNASETIVHLKKNLDANLNNYVASVNRLC